MISDQALAALPLLKDCLGGSLVALYLHGSAVAGGLRPRSDLDLLAVVDGPLDLETRKRLTATLLGASGRYPPKPTGIRPIDLGVFQRSELASSRYPISSEFCYGEWLRNDIEAGLIPGAETNPDFTLIIAQTRSAATALFGPDAIQLLPALSQASVRRAITDALPTLLGNLRGDERNVLLTFARMWHTLTTGRFVPKDVAAEWSIPRLSGEAAELMALARAGYLGLKEDTWGERESATEWTAGLIAARLADQLSNPLLEP